MPGNTRNLLLFATLAGAALVTWIFSRVSEESGPARTDAGPFGQGYYLLGATLNGTDDDGRIYYRIVADRVEQSAENEDIVLDGIRVEYVPDTDVRWDISAGRGLADASRNSLRLQSEVRLVYMADPGQDAMLFETNELNFFAEEFFASTDQSVTMYRGEAIVTAENLELNLNTDAWILGTKESDNSNVTLRSSH